MVGLLQTLDSHSSRMEAPRYAQIHTPSGFPAVVARPATGTQMLTFLQGDPAIHTFDQALSRDDGRVQRISRLLDGFLDFLDQNHREHRWTGRRGSDAGTGWQPTVVMTVGRSGRAKPAIPSRCLADDRERIS